MQVFAGNENVAPKGTASQSSVAFDGPAKLAIDGNTDGDYFESKSVTHNNQEDNPWWEVDLGSDRPIERLAIWNRTDGGGTIGSRLAGYKVSILDDKRNVVWQQSPKDVPSPSSELADERCVSSRIQPRPWLTFRPRARRLPASSSRLPMRRPAGA